LGRCYAIVRDARDLKNWCWKPKQNNQVVINLVSTSFAPAEAAFLDGAIEYLMRLTGFGS
jgi:hypothetical protein